MKAGDYWNIHRGETCLIVSNGPNLHLTPPEWFDYPSIGVNRLYKYDGWKPDYYVAVDAPLWEIYGQDVVAAYPDIPKFAPSPGQDRFYASNMVLFKHFASSGHYIGGHLPTQYEALTTHGITYQRVLGAVFQIAMYMGFFRMLVIGLQHKPGDDSHFWDDGDKRHPFNGDESLNIWFDEYRHWAHMGAAEILNISEDTYVPEHIIPRDDWRKWANRKDKKALLWAL